jgi:hypothetical protein
VIGAAGVAGGAAGLTTSGGAVVASGGAAAPVAAVTATASAGLVAKGGQIAMNAIDNLKNDKGRVNAEGNSGGGEAKQRNKPKESGTPNSSEIQSRDKSGKIDKYSTYDQNGKIVKEYRGSGKDHGNIPRPNVKEPKYNLNPKTGEKFQNGYEVRKAKSDEIPK